MREGALDLYGLANRNGLAGGFDSEFSNTLGNAVSYRNANTPRPPAFIIQQADLDTVANQFGDFQKPNAQQQTAMIDNIAKATELYER